MTSAPTPSRIRAARILAVAADAVQLVGFPVFGEGFASPFNDALDVVVGGILIYLVGFHWAFLPGFLVELVPGFNLVPIWTVAVFLATSGQGARPRPDHAMWGPGANSQPCCRLPSHAPAGLTYTAVIPGPARPSGLNVDAEPQSSAGQSPQAGPGSPFPSPAAG